MKRYIKDKDIKATYRGIQRTKIYGVIKKYQGHRYTGIYREQRCTE